MPSLYVLGHKNPDTDSICSAIGYAELLRQQGHSDAVAARQGAVRRETAYVLERFGLPEPRLLTDVRTRVEDVMTSPPTVVHEEDSLFELGQLLQRESIRTVPVIDDNRHLRGVIGLRDLANAFLADLDSEDLDRLALDLDNVIKTLNGTLVVSAPGRRVRDRVMVGAMKIESMLTHLEPDIVLVMGDREDAQLAAIDSGIGALVVTGDLPVTERVVQRARERGVNVVSVPHHTYNTVRLLRLSSPVRFVMRTDAPTCSPDDLVEEVRQDLLVADDRFLVVVDDADVVVGLISRSNLLRTVRRRVVLVDHNERGQTVEGIEDADIVGVVDHHRVADFQTRAPLLMRVEPLGSTSTIVGQMFAESGLEVPAPVAGALLSGILADTLLFRGPTTTAEDRRIASALAKRAEVDLDELGGEILAIASDVSERSAEELLAADFKVFNAEGELFGIGVIETTNGTAVLSRRLEILEAMERTRGEGYASVLFAVIDIVMQCTTVLVVGYPRAVAEALDTPLLNEDVVEVPKILSRKKDLVPLLGTIARSIVKQ